MKSLNSNSPRCAFYLRQFKHIQVVFIIIYLAATKLSGQSLSQYYTAYDHVLPNTGILFNKGYIQPKMFSPFLVDSDPVVYLTTPDDWQQHYALMRASLVDINLQWPTFEEFYQSPSNSSSEVPIAGLFLEGNFIQESVMYNHYNQSNHTFFPNTPMDTIPIGLFSNLRPTVQGTTVHFTFDTQHLFSNLPASDIQSLSIDFDDGSGEHVYAFQNFDIEIQYPHVGPKQLRFSLKTTKGHFNTYSLLEVQTDQSLAGTQIRNITANLPGGQAQEGVYSLNVSCDGVFDRPVIIVEGFDPVNEADSLELQKKYFNAGLLTYLLDYGYDIIGLQFRNNNDFLQNNAAVVKELIKQISIEKKGDFEIIIVGESNGGLNTRIALSQLEAENFDHKVGLYISFDSPQAGANIPLGVQEFGYDSQNLDFSTTDALGVIGFALLGGAFGTFTTIAGLYIDLGGGQDLANYFLDQKNKDIRKIIKANDSPAARQQLIRHRDEDYIDYIISPEHDFFYKYLKLIGYPGDCRRITLINGSNTATPQNAAFGEKIVDLNYDLWGLSFIFSAEGYAKISPINTPSAKVSAINSNALFFDLVDEKGCFNFNTDMAYDLAPGGINKNSFIRKPYGFSLVSSTIDLDESLTNSRFGSGDFDTGLFYFDESSTDPKRKRAYLIKNKLTPFNEIYSNPTNTEHISFDEIGNLVEDIALREFMFERLFLQNREFRNGWRRQFYARDEAFAGREVTAAFLPDKMVDTADVTVKSGAHVDLSAAKRIHLKPGVRVEQGAYFKASQVADATQCHSPFSDGSQVYRKIVPAPRIEKTYVKAAHKTTFSVLNKYVGATDADYSWRLVGNGLDNNYSGPSFTEYDLPAGVYSVTCLLFGGERETLKYFQVKEDASDEVVELRQGSLLLYGQQQNNEIQLIWNIPEGMPCYEFTVERQGAIGKWDSITLVSSNENQSVCRATDFTPSTGFNFYRLHWTTREGKVIYSNPYSVWFQSRGDFQVSPNPAKESVTINFDGLNISKGRLFITDSNGHQIWHQDQLSMPNINIPLEGFAKGIYNVTFSEEGKPARSKRLIIN